MLFFRFFLGDNSPKLCKKISHIQSCQQTKKVVGKKLKTLAPSFGQPFQCWIKKWILKNLVFLFTCLKRVTLTGQKWNFFHNNWLTFTNPFLLFFLLTEELFLQHFIKKVGNNVSKLYLDSIMGQHCFIIAEDRNNGIPIRTHYFASTVPEPAFSLTLKIKTPKFFFKIKAQKSVSH